MAAGTGWRVRTFVVWEPVLFTDWSSPSTATLGRMRQAGAAQYWDKDRVISHSLGEHDRGSIVWDFIAIYPAGEVWGESPPKAMYEGGPVVRVLRAASAALAEATKREQSRGLGRSEQGRTKMAGGWDWGA